VYDQTLATRIVRRFDPELSETPLSGMRKLLTDPDKLYVRNHFPVPTVEESAWRLSLTGMVKKPLSLSTADLAELPTVSALTVIECAGNSGSSGHLLRGGVGVVEWGGVPLSSIIRDAQPHNDAAYATVRGIDTGRDPDEDPDVVVYERSLPLDDLIRRGILATHMNGEPLNADHGWPGRLVVPGWYAMDWIKWVCEIEFTDTPSESVYMTKRYRRYQYEDGESYGPLVRQMAVKSAICLPAPNEVVAGTPLNVEGFAWTGSGAIEQVEVKCGSSEWQAAEIRMSSDDGDIVWWQTDVAPVDIGSTLLVSRARDTSGRIQPAAPHGGMYECNHVSGITVHSVGDEDHGPKP